MKKNAVSLFITIFGLTAAGCSQIRVSLPPVPETAYTQNETASVIGLADAETSEDTTAEAVETTADVRDFDEMMTVNSSEEFFALLREARNSLVPEMHLKITDYSEEYYDINNFEKGKYTLISQGKRWGSMAHMDYTFVYSESYAVTRAIEEPSLTYRLTDEQKAVIERLKALQPQLVHDGMSDYEKELAIHNYLVSNFEYDTNAVVNGEVSEYATRISDFLDTHKGVCEAYAYTFKALCNLSGIECHVIAGTLDGVGHAWNLIKLDGNYYHVDVTADDPVPDEAGHVFYNYLNLTDARISRTHTFENKWYECTATQYDYFIRNGLTVSSSAEFNAFIERELSAGKTTIVFRAVNYYVNGDDIGSALNYKGFSSYTIAGDTNDPNGDFEIRLTR